MKSPRDPLPAAPETPRRTTPPYRRHVASAFRPYLLTAVRNTANDWLRASRRTDGLAALTSRERHVLALMAEGRSNAGIADSLVVTGGTVEKHVASIFAKLGLPPDEGDNRRVLAVLRYLGS